jgi:general secretion pathway protein H
MPTSAIGEIKRDGGFTLVEMLVVLAILGVAAGAILLTVPDSRQSLTREAERFAASLVRAKEEAVLTNRIVDVRITPEGYEFGATTRGVRRPLAGRAFGSVAWNEETTAMIGRGDERSRILFDATGMATPAAIDLYRSYGHARVIVDGSGSVRIDAAQR